jgi:chorismate synthase
MFGSTYGNIFKISTWGESHGKGLGVVIDGCPAGLELSEEDIQIFLNRRKPGQNKFTTPRKENDSVQIMSGVYQGKTTGTPISMMILNKTQRSEDYNEIASFYRPGHADYTFDMKFGFRDPRGGGRSSGRETIGRTAAGAIASKLLSNLGIKIIAYTKSIGSIEIDMEHFNLDEIKNNPLNMPDAHAAAKAALYLEKCMKQQDSSGGIVECIVKHMPPGIGEPVFEKLDANLSKAIMSLGSVKAFEIGSGIVAASNTGQENNDNFYYDENGNVKKHTNHAGGILGGLSDGSDIIMRASIKPTPSIASTQSTINNSGENIEVNIKGRHDPIIVPRAVVVIESMAAITILDMILGNMTSRLDKIIDFYSK